MTKFAQHKAPKSIAWGKLTFDERVAVHCVKGTPGVVESTGRSNLKMEHLRTFAWKPRPESDLDCLVCVRYLLDVVRNMERNS